MSHVFISYVHENQDQVEKLCEALRKHGTEVWLDRDSISPGIRWKDAIRQAIKSGAYFIACFSSEYENRDKNYMNEELMLAIDELRQYSPSRPWFIPVLFSECNVPAFSIGGGQTLLDFQWVNMYSDWNSGFRKLLKVLKSDEINILKLNIDQFGRRYIKRLGIIPATELDNVLRLDGIAVAKRFYLESVRELREIYGIEYDPIKLEYS